MRIAPVAKYVLGPRLAHAEQRRNIHGAAVVASLEIALRHRVEQPARFGEVPGGAGDRGARRRKLLFDRR